MGPEEWKTFHWLGIRTNGETRPVIWIYCLSKGLKDGYGRARLGNWKWFSVTSLNEILEVMSWKGV